jgi:hypothetical protein
MKALGHMPVCGVDLPVKAGDEKDNSDLTKAYGCFDLDTSTVWLDENLPRHAADFWRTHEALHAVLNLSGAIYATAAALGMKRDDPRIDEWEEMIVRVLTPHIIETFGPARVRK